MVLCIPVIDITSNAPYIPCAPQAVGPVKVTFAVWTQAGVDPTGQEKENQVFLLDISYIHTGHEDVSVYSVDQLKGLLHTNLFGTAAVHASQILSFLDLHTIVAFLFLFHHLSICS